jgi:hypothetical protein
MKQHRGRRVTWALAVLTVTPLCGVRLAAQDGVTLGGNAGQAYARIEGQDVPPSIPVQEQPEVLSRGPVHEAFAEPVSLQPQAGLLAPNPPPPNIEEIPPAERPQGAQFVWIPGYWSWDGDRNGYIWVSACWRAAPPRMSWVPGYWSPASGGWEWVAGFWTPAGVREIEYLPAPPVAGGMEPLGPKPFADAIWVPPCMYWVQGRYVQRDGYWLAAQPNWVWVPAHYVVTPRGYIFAEGHWDYSLERRGVLFAPVYFPASVHVRSGFTYSPSIVIDLSLLRFSLFAYPRYSHYYFGDYYDDAYLRIGIYPWFDSRRVGTWYDPVYEHARWTKQRTEPRWEAHARDEYNRRRADTALRPARTYREQESRLAKLPEPERRAHQVAQPMTVAITSREAPLKFEQINRDAQQKISRQAAAVRTFGDERNRWESTKAGPAPVQPPKDRSGMVPAPVGRPATVQPPKDRGGMVPAPVGRPATVQPPQDRGGMVPAPVGRPATVQPPKDSGGVVPSPVGRAPVVQPPRDRGGAVPQPIEHKGAAAPPAQRGNAFVPPREVHVNQREKVQIPASPAVGRSGVLGIFQKGPPARPADEDKDKAGKHLR